MFFKLLPRATLSVGAIVRWHLIRPYLGWLLPTAPTGRVLDMGCGRGEYVIDMASRFSGHVLGIDEMGHDAAGAFIKIPALYGERVRFVATRLDPDTSASLGCFDGVLCVDVLEHIAEDYLFLSTLSAAVNCSGKLLLHVPARNQWHPVRAAREALASQLDHRTGQHVREGYTKNELFVLLESTGWIVESLRPTFGRIATLWSDIDYALSLVGRKTLPLRCAMLPLTIIGGLGSRMAEPKQGNGWLVRAIRASQL